VVTGSAETSKQAAARQLLVFQYALGKKADSCRAVWNLLFPRAKYLFMKKNSQ